MPSNWRITVTLPERIKKFLEEWAEAENRSVSNLAATILISAVDQQQQSNKPQQGALKDTETDESTSS